MESQSSREGHLQGDKFTNKDLDSFFANGLYNSNEATDDLIKAIEKAKDEALAKRALDLYQRHLSTLERPWDHVTFMYGLGLIYMHFNAYNLAVKAFREAIYVQPSFARTRDVHTRLGLIFKANGRYKLSEKHFNLAINDNRPNSGACTKLELEFQLAHLFEIQGKLKQAKEAYERLLQQRDLPPKLSANIQRQLGGLYFFNDTDGSATSRSNNNRQQQQNMLNNNHNDAFSYVRVDAALNYLNSSYQNDSDPKTSYYLGRCFKDIDKSRDAFASYRSMIDREESTADTWCSIGVLYHRNNQQTDALLAFIRSVQFDKQHAAAWMNAGILYENQNQFQDALKCYQHVIRSSCSNGIDRCSLLARIRYIQKQMNEIETSLNSMGCKSKLGTGKLLSLEDVWNLESQTRSKTSTNSGSSSSSSSGGAGGAGGDGGSGNNINNIIVNATADKDKASKVSIPSSCSNVNSIQEAHKTLSQPTTTSKSLDISTVTNQQNGIIVRNHNNLEETKDPNLLNKSANKFENSGSLDVKVLTITTTERTTSNSVYTNSTLKSNHVGLSNDCKLEKSDQDLNRQDFKPSSNDSKEFNLNPVLTNGASKDSGISSNSSTYADCALLPSQNLDVTIAEPITAEQVIEACINAPKPRKIDVNLRNNDDEPPNLFPSRPPYPPLQHDKLFPSPPSVFLETKKDLTSKRLQEYCQSSSISIVRNLASVLKLDLGLFSTKTLVEISADQQVEIFSHPFHQNGDNHDEHIFNHWACERQRSSSTISRYASYQVATFKESLQEEIETKSNGSKANNLTKESETDSNESASAQAKRLNSNTQQSTSTTTNNQLNNESQQQNINNINSTTISNQNTSASGCYKGPASKKLKKDVSPSKVKFVRSADGIDLSDDKKWRLQLNELNKLPNFIKCVSASNMLTHCGSTIPGINTTVMGMHVPGCRILGNGTPNNFCSININVGPGDYEWCAVSPEYASLLTRLCNKNGYELEERNWWPKMEDLKKYNIPVYRFSQRPGDLIWVNSGTIYWIQAIGWCNNIYWNVGPLSARQYRLASEKTEINKLIFSKSDVPMIQLTWNIVININVITDDELYASITDVLRRSLRYCVLVKDLTDESKQTIEYSNEEPGPTNAKFCSTCECEVFNIYFIKKQDSSIFHCVECARRSDPTLGGYNIRQNYELKYLMELYDKFVETKRKFQHHQRQ